MNVRHLFTIGAVGVALCCNSFAARGAELAPDKAQQADEPELSDVQRVELEAKLMEVLHERLKVATRCVAAVQASFDAQTVTLGDLIEAKLALNEAQLAVATTRKQRLDIMQRNVALLRQMEKKTELLYRVGTRGGEAARYARAKRTRLTAEIELMREQLKAER